MRLDACAARPSERMDGWMDVMLALGNNGGGVVPWVILILFDSLLMFACPSLF